MIATGLRHAQCAGEGKRRARDADAGETRRRAARRCGTATSPGVEAATEAVRRPRPPEQAPSGGATHTW